MIPALLGTTTNNTATFFQPGGIYNDAWWIWIRIWARCRLDLWSRSFFSGSHRLDNNPAVLGVDHLSDRSILSVFILTKEPEQSVIPAGRTEGPFCQRRNHRR